MTRIAVLFTNYGPYHLARLRSLYEHCSRTGWEVVGIELARQELEYAWNANIEGLPFSIVSVIKNQPLEQAKFSRLLQRLYIVLSQLNPDVLVIAGYSRPAMLSTLLWCIWNRKPTVLMCESKLDDAERGRFKETFKGWILKGYNAALVGGTPQKSYLTTLGMASDAIFSGYNVVDNNLFQPDNIKSFPNPLDNPYFLAINRFVPKKNLSLFISAYASYYQAAGSKAWHLVLCGDGELQPQIEKQIADLALKDAVHLPGFLQQEELLPYFAHAKYFVHASTQEQWGLVVNEAMAAGLPVLVSNRCGCFEDLVVEGINGFGFDPENSQQLTNLMLKMSSGEVNLQTMGDAALEHIQKFSPDYFAQGLIQAVTYAMAQR